MESLIEKIKNSENLERFNYKSKHIFDDLISHFKNSINQSDMAILYYYMNLSEKSLFSFREGDIENGNFYFSKSSTYEKKFKEPISNGMLSLHYALFAYKNYVEKEYYLAQMHLEKAIDFSKNQAATFPYFIITVGEQSLNKIRLYARVLNKDKVVIEAINIISLFLYKNSNDLNITKSIDVISEDDKYGMLRHIINNTQQAIVKAYGKEITIEIFEEIAKGLSLFFKENDNLRNLDIAFRCIYYSTYNRILFIDMIEKNLDEILSCPKSLKDIILEKII